MSLLDLIAADLTQAWIFHFFKSGLKLLSVKQVFEPKPAQMQAYVEFMSYGMDSWIYRSFQKTCNYDLDVDVNTTYKSETRNYFNSDLTWMWHYSQLPYYQDLTYMYCILKVSFIRPLEPEKHFDGNLSFKY